MDTTIIKPSRIIPKQGNPTDMFLNENRKISKNLTLRILLALNNFITDLISLDLLVIILSR